MNMVKNLDSLNWLMSLWWSAFSLAQSAGCVLGNTLIIFFGFLFQEFWKEMGEMGLLGITAPGETSGQVYPVNIFVYSQVQTEN